jgi:hypothetical protein
MGLETYVPLALTTVNQTRIDFVHHFAPGLVTFYTVFHVHQLRWMRKQEKGET